MSSNVMLLVPLRTMRLSSLNLMNDFNAPAYRRAPEQLKLWQNGGARFP
jgi:hypothetical protein